MEIQKQNDDIYSFTQSLISQVVKEQDKYTMKVIEDWAKSQGAIPAIIPEGKLKHILNLGLTTYNSIQREPRKMLAKDYFPETEYSQYLENTIRTLSLENSKLRERIEMLGRWSGLSSTEVNLGEEDEDV